MNILVIGNGFDLAHDLKTTYKDFLEYHEARDKRRIIGLINYSTTFIDNIWLRHFIIRKYELGNTWIDLEQEIYNVIQTVAKAIYTLSNGEINRIFPVIFSVQKDIIDFDFDNIGKYLRPADRSYKTNNKGYLSLDDREFSTLYTYVESYHGFINFLYDKLREFIKEFENYLINNVCSNLNNESKYLLHPKIDGELYVLSFNYTDICESLYQPIGNTDRNLWIKSVYVHGRICKDNNCNLVLGTHSFDNTNIPTDFNVFKKHNQRHKYGTIEAYQELLKKLNEPKKIVKPVFHVVGHSLDKTDHNILKHAFLANKNAVINIYYHNEEAQERLINNITEIIGEEEVMTKVRLIYQHDEKRGILKLKA